MNIRQAVLIGILLIATSVQAQVTQTASVFSAGGANAAGSGATLSSVLGDVVIGPSAQGTNGIWSGFCVPGRWPVTGIEDAPTFVERTQLGRIYPNPARSVAAFRVSSARLQRVAIYVFDVSGRLVRHLFSGTMGPGVFPRSWDLRSDQGQRVASGVYFAQLRTPSGLSTARFVVLR